MNGDNDHEARMTSTQRHDLRRPPRRNLLETGAKHPHTVT
jgi:hypothetical protein